MENEVEEENTTTPDWLDLPDPIATNVILEHLDIVNYIRFSAVCKKWQSIQKEHRIRHSPYPPHSPLTFPWLSVIICFFEDMNFHCYLTGKQKAYNIPLFKIPKDFRFSRHYRFGWLLFLFKLDEFYRLFILNPITGVQIELSLFQPIFFDVAFMSSPPTDPDCTIVMLDYDGNVYLYRLNDNTGLIKTGYSKRDKGRTFFCHNKIYYMVGSTIIYVVDALVPDPVEHMIEMDCSDICVDFRRGMHLVDFLGELVMVLVEYDKFIDIDYDTIKEFHVYRADFSTNKWIRMESFGDHALFFSYDCMFSLPVVDVGCQKNTIYLPGGLMACGVAWRAFNISTKIWIDGPSMSLPSKEHHFYSFLTWFLPSLDYYNVAKTNRACRIQLKG